jgi:sulfate permease, SulP family
MASTRPKTTVSPGAGPGGRRFPLFQGFLPLSPKQVPVDIVAGITLAALGIPEVMGYTKIAGMPVVTGLYTILVPIAVFAILGSSRHLVVGADSATAAIMAAGLTGMAAIGSPQYVALAGLVALLTGGFLLLARIIRLGFLADFLSKTVLVGFLTGVGIQVAVGQLAGMLGVTGGGDGTAQQLVNTIKDLPDTSVATLAVSLGVLGVILGSERISKKIPGALIAVVGAIWASYAFDWAAHGIATLGKVPSGLPTFGIPNVDWADAAALAGTAASIFLVVLAQSAATSRAYAMRYTERFDENIDLVGLAGANVAAGLSGTFVVNGSPTKTEMVDSAGGRSEISQLTTAAIVLIVLLFLTKPLRYMPEAVLASVVFLIGAKLVDVPGMRVIWRLRKDEFVVALITAATVVFVGVEQGIILAVVVSILDHIRRSYHPNDTVLVRTPSGHWKAMPLSTDAETEPGLVIYHFGASLYYANANRFGEEVLRLVTEDEPSVEWFAIDCATVADIDYSASETLRQIRGELKDKGVTLVLSDVADPVKALLDRYGLTELIGADRIFDGVPDVLDAYRARPGHEGTQT